MDDDWLEARILAFACAYLHDGSAWKVVGWATCTFVFHCISIYGQRDVCQ